MDKIATSIRLTKAAVALWKKIAERRGISQTAVLESLIREEAQRAKIKAD